MSDPLNAGDTDNGLNSAEAQDWADPRTTNIARLMAFVILPSIFVLIAAFALYWGLTHQKKPVAAVTPPAATAPAVPVVDKDAQIAQLQAQILALQGQARPAEQGATPVPPQPLYSADPTALAAMSARLDRVEANQRALAKAASSAFAARTLQLAAKTQQPFLSELAVVEPSLDDPALVATLRPYAEKGVPSEVSLAVAFPAAAARANVAAKNDDGKTGPFDQIWHAVSGFISIRRTDDPNGQGTEAVLQRAEARLNSGDLKGAVAYLDALSPTAKKALSPWLDQAHARILIDDTTRRISETALNRLSQMPGTTADLNNGGVL